VVVIDIEFRCGTYPCLEAEVVDVYAADWRNGTPLNRYLPEGWTLTSPSPGGYADVKCPEHSWRASK
jgi:hypothetical protein